MIEWLRRVCPMLCVAALLVGCDKPYCERFCTKIRDQLISQFDVPPASIDCSDPKWSGTECAQCEHVLEVDYGVSLGNNGCPE